MGACHTTKHLVMKVKLNLPRDHFSYSQMDLWLKNREAYRERYYRGGPSFENTATIFGKRIAKMLEDGVADPVLDKVPKYQFMEHRIELKVNGIPFLGVMDSFSKRMKSFYEYKTGKEKWDQLRAEKHSQLVVYALLTKLKYGTFDPWAKLVWIETRNRPETRTFDGHDLEGNSNEIEFTGKIQIFHRKIENWELNRMKQLIKKTALAISEDYTKFQHEEKIRKNI